MEANKILSILQESYDRNITRVEFLRDGGGTTYIVNSEAQKYLLKIAGGAFLDTFRQSVDIMCYLANCEFPVPAIIKTKSGLPILEISEQGQEYQFVLYEYIEGKEPDLCVCCEKVGDLVGQLHELLLAYTGELVERDFRYFIERYINILRKKNYPQADAYAHLGASLWERVKDCPVGVCHGDLHRGNLLETAEGKIYLLDFDAICRAPRMFDVMVMCDMTDYFDLQNDDVITTKAVYESFLTGYTRHIDLKKMETASFNDWVAIRHFQLQATIVEIFGIDCNDNHFIDRQLEWLIKWSKLSHI